jgi:5-(carboxyamino)imidazole ribonucleotide synthase
MGKNFYNDFKLGILGGGQLGRMLIQAAVDYNLYISVLDPDIHAPCRQIASDFEKGSLTDFETVYSWGRNKDLITIEIENVNVDALEKLEQEGVKVFPQPGVIKIIQDKRLQKKFYSENQIPTADFVLIEDPQEIAGHISFLPAYQKLGKAGYDGRGVMKINSPEDLKKALPGKSLLEKLVDYQKEISVIVARSSKGEVITYPVVEMVFHPVHNLVEYLFAPADISKDQEEAAKKIAVKVITELNMTGILAVEMFLTRSGEILVNEVAPRPHNSGHHTIKANFTSQYEQHLRAILGLPLGLADYSIPSALVNLLGEPGYEGEAKYEGIEKVLSVEGAYIHLYGKKFTKPFRKMGHVTIVDKDIISLKKKAEFVKKTLKVIC